MRLPKPKAIAVALGPEIAWLALAAGVHAAAFTVLPSSTARYREGVAFEPTPIEVIDQIVAPEPPLEESEPEVIKPPPKPRAAKAPPEPVEPTKEPPAAADEVPIAFDNMVLSNSDSGSAWEIDTREDAVVTGQNVQGKVGGVIGGDGEGLVVDVGDLSRQPVPPGSLKSKLESNYPKKAKGEAKEGDVVVRLRVNADGRPSRVRLLREDPAGYGFGNACLLTLQDEPWKPGVDQGGQRVGTDISFTCRFRVRF